jgi:uncharacterized damage-inducible protein DinB
VDAESMARIAGFSQRSLQMNLEGISHRDALAQPPHGGNCANWIVGHVLVHRDVMLAALGHPPVWTDPARERYDRGSPPITGDGPDVVPLDRLRELLERTGEAVPAAIRAAGDAKLAEAAEKGTVGSNVAFLQFHEGYHSGQLGLLRRILGKEGAIR